MHYVHVDSLDQTLERILELGGSVLRPKAAVPKTAWYAVVADPEGNIFAIWQADPTGDADARTRRLSRTTANP